MTRHLFLIALLTVLLPAGVSPAHRMDALEARPFVAALRAQPCAQRGITRTERRMVAAQPVRGVFLIPARRPKVLFPFQPNTRLPNRATPRAVLLRAPPTLA